MCDDEARIRVTLQVMVSGATTIKRSAIKSPKRRRAARRGARPALPGHGIVLYRVVLSRIRGGAGVYGANSRPAMQ